MAVGQQQAKPRIGFGDQPVRREIGQAQQFPDDLALANYYRTALMIKYTLAGLTLGLVFWRWCLPYAMICHIAANGVHLALQKSLFQAGTIA